MRQLPVSARLTAPLLIALLLLTSCGISMGTLWEINERRKLVDAVEAVILRQEIMREVYRLAIPRIDEILSDLSKPLPERLDSLQALHGEMVDEYEGSDRLVVSVERQCKRLFDAWASQIPGFTNDAYRVSREVHLHRSEQTCNRTLVRMRAAQNAVKPVLGRFGRELRHLRQNQDEDTFIESGRKLRRLRGEVETLLWVLADSINQGNDFVALIKDVLLEAPA